MIQSQEYDVIGLVSATFTVLKFLWGVFNSFIHLRIGCASKRAETKIMELNIIISDLRSEIENLRNQQSNSVIVE